MVVLRVYWDRPTVFTSWVDVSKYALGLNCYVCLPFLLKFSKLISISTIFVQKTTKYTDVCLWPTTVQTQNEFTKGPKIRYLRTRKKKSTVCFNRTQSLHCEYSVPDTNNTSSKHKSKSFLDSRHRSWGCHFSCNMPFQLFIHRAPSLTPTFLNPAVYRCIARSGVCKLYFSGSFAEWLPVGCLQWVGTVWR